MGGRGSSSASARKGAGQVRGYFDYRNPYTGTRGEPSTQKQRDYIGDLLKDPISRADATLRLGTLPDASKITKNEASRLIDDLKTNRNVSHLRVDNATFLKIAEDRQTLSEISEMRANARTSGESATTLSSHRQETVNAYNDFSKKYGLGIKFELKKRKPRRRSL